MKMSFVFSNVKIHMSFNEQFQFVYQSNDFSQLPLLSVQFGSIILSLTYKADGIEFDEF